MKSKLFLLCFTHLTLVAAMLIPACFATRTIAPEENERSAETTPETPSGRETRSDDNGEDANNDRATTGIQNGIVWYGVLNDGLEVARETGRPIFLLSAAPQCAGVPGMW